MKPATLIVIAAALVPRPALALTASQMATTLGLNPTYSQTDPIDRGLGVAGDRVYQAGAPSGLQWCGDNAPEPAPLASKAYTVVSRCKVPTSVPLGANGIGGVPTWAFSISYMATVEAGNQGFGALVLNVTDDSGLLGPNGATAEQDFTAQPGFNPVTVTFDADNIPAHDSMTVTAWVYNGTAEDWKMQTRGAAPGSLGAGRTSTLAIRLWNN